MQTKDTLRCKEAFSVVKEYLEGKQVVDPFARNCEFAYPYTNDINPETKAQDHMDVEEYLEYWHRQQWMFDGAIYDPPFSDRQAKEAYGQTNLYTLAGKVLRVERSLGDLIMPGGYVVKFGYNSNFSHKAFECVEIKLLRYGGSMNDMIISVHKKMFETFKDMEIDRDAEE
tara:strand:+ start:418 stop:930 length:513 start_codon:yes stop_codon:yes gene_type:complete